MLNAHLLELTLTELEDFLGAEIQLVGDLDRDYAVVRKLFLRGEVESLKKVVFQLSKNANHSDLRALAELRLAIRLETKNVGAFGHSKELAENGQGTLKAETQLVLAMYCETFGDEVSAERLYHSAYLGFKDLGCPKKTSSAYLNRIAARSRIEPDKRLFVEYRRALTLAKLADDKKTQGTILKNLSREYQLIGALNLALQYAVQSVEIIADEAYGTYDYYQAIAHRCHVLAQLGREIPALRDFEEISTTTLPDFEAIQSELVEVLKKYEIKTPQLPVTQRASTPSSTWAERKVLAPAPTLSELEDRFVSLLAAGPKEKSQIVVELYGESAKSRYFEYENRFKQLLHRLKKKRANIVAFQSGKYFLLESAQAI